MTTVAKPQRVTRDLPWLVGLGILVVIGLVAWIIQLTQGFGVVGVGQEIVWGVYIAAFFTLAGLASGLVILAALSDLGVIHNLDQYRNRMLVGALAGFIASGIMILMDIGQPTRVLNIIFSANLSSPFVWDFTSLALSVIITAIYLYTGPKSKWVVALAAVLAALVVLAEGLILSMSVAGALWHGGMMPVIFLLEGVLAAAAILLLLQSDPLINRWLSRVVITLLVALAILNLFEFVTLSYAGQVDARAAVALFWTGSLAPLFWLQAGLGILLPFLLLLFAARQRLLVQIAAVLAILGVFFNKLVVLISGQALSFMQAQARYTPTWIEIAGLFGVIGLAGLLFVLGKSLKRKG